MSYKIPTIKHNRLKVNTSQEGEPLHEKLERMQDGKEPITMTGGGLFTARKDGVNPATDIRTDRFEIAIDQTDKITRSYQAKREAWMNPENKNDGKPESTQGTQQSPSNK